MGSNEKIDQKSDKTVFDAISLNRDMRNVFPQNMTDRQAKEHLKKYHPDKAAFADFSKFHSLKRNYDFEEKQKICESISKFLTTKEYQNSDFSEKCSSTFDENSFQDFHKNFEQKFNFDETDSQYFGQNEDHENPFQDYSDLPERDDYSGEDECYPDHDDDDYGDPYQDYDNHKSHHCEIYGNELNDLEKVNKSIHEDADGNLRWDCPHCNCENYCEDGYDCQNPLRCQFSSSETNDKIDKKKEEEKFKEEQSKDATAQYWYNQKKIDGSFNKVSQSQENSAWDD
jgi:hypothetical protein